jgi:predicted DCC family thiol-disulfide oxidoreductase YuxK
MNPAPLLLYDGTCGFCSATVRFVLRHDRRGTVRFATLDSRAAARVIGRHPELAGVDSVVWVEPAGPDSPETVAVRSDAVVRVARYLGGPWHATRVAALLPRAWRDRAYDWVARHRHRLPGADRCFVPPPEARAPDP